MMMPKAAVHKNDFLAGGKCDVGRSGQIFPVQAVSIAQPVHRAPDDEFYVRVLGANVRHQAAFLPGGIG